MIDPKIFDELSKRLSAIIVASPAADIEKNVRALLSRYYASRELVTREELDVQAQVLQRTREKLQALEARMTEMEKASGSDPQ